MKKIFLATIADALNAYLKLDPESEKRLQKLKGKVITIEFLPFHLVFQCLFGERGIEIQKNELVPANAKLCGTPLQMGGVMLSKKHRQQLFTDDLTITGDAALGQQVVELFDELEIDWEEQLSRFIGDVPSYHMGRLLREAGEWLQKTDKSIALDINDYMHEEIKWFPAREALQDFFHEVDTLRMDTDRIAARVHYLQKSLTENEEPK